MKIGILRLPHQNARYYESTRDLMHSELEIMLKGMDLDVQDMAYETIEDLELLTFVCESMTEALKDCLNRVSNAFVVFECHGDMLKPIIGKKQTYFKEDLSSILKYQGKTNEDFTKMMINIGVFSSKFAKDFQSDLMVFDPMCGRGTTLYESLILGYNASGIEVKKGEILELNKYLLRYLKYNRLKHAHSHQNIVLGSKKHGVKYSLETANDNGAYKKGDIRTLQYAIGDTREANLYYKKNSFHTMVTDLPYGVQHVGRGKEAPEGLSDILDQAMPEWHKLLKPGGTLVIAYNAMTLKRDVMVKLMAKHNFKVMNEPPYDAMEHWVEQAVSRDIIVGMK